MPGEGSPIFFIMNRGIVTEWKGLTIYSDKAEPTKCSYCQCKFKKDQYNVLMTVMKGFVLNVHEHCYSNNFNKIYQKMESIRRHHRKGMIRKSKRGSVDTKK